MILNHLWGLYAHPKEEWHTIDTRHESFRYSLIHILLVALIPMAMACPMTKTSALKSLALKVSALTLWRQV